MTARFRAVCEGSTPEMEKALDETDQKEDNTNAQGADSQDADNRQTGLRRVEQNKELRNSLNDPVADESKDLEDGSRNATGAGEHRKSGQECQIHKSTTFRKIIYASAWPQPEHLTKKKGTPKIKKIPGRT